VSAEGSDPIRIATAGWGVPKAVAEDFPERGSSLQRYAGVFNAVEINSTFYRPHRLSTFARWATSVPEDFRFSVKMPRDITHIRRLADCGAAVSKFIDEARGLDVRLGPILIQLPPGLAFDAATAEAFFALFRRCCSGSAACEPRHPSWFDPKVHAMLNAYRISRVVADPAPAPEAAHPGGFEGLLYVRLHGSPRMYYSSYSDGRLDDAAAMLSNSSAAERWCVFDNTASGAAIVNALHLRERIRKSCD
jgi:uncharacterized protein YecE (DUF72 family)